MTNNRPKPITAPALMDWMRSDQPLQLVDVRESQELALASFPADVVHLPLSGSSDWLDSLRERLSAEVPVVVLCHAGIRSLHFGQWLLEQEWGLDVWNLDGGIDAWSLQVDPTTPRY